MNPTDPRFRDITPAQAVVPVPASAAPASSAAARAYRLQLTRITKLKSQLAELEEWAQSHRLALHETVHPLKQEHRQQLRAMVLLIDARLAGKSLTAPQRQAAAEILCGLAATLARQGDEQMAKLHDRHSPHTLAEDDQHHAQMLRAELEVAMVLSGCRNLDEIDESVIWRG